MSRRLEILETARKLFNESNTQAVTTNHIAKAMGISPGNLHYHYCNREEIIRLLYTKMREEMTLSIEALPKTLKELSKHQKMLIGIQWEYRFFFREILFLFSRDALLEKHKRTLQGIFLTLDEPEAISRMLERGRKDDIGSVKWNLKV